MKKIFAIISALVISAAAFAANEYNAVISNVKVNDISEGTSYAYEITFSQVATTVSGTSSYNGTGYLIIYPENHSIEGTFSLAEYTLDEFMSYLNTSSGKRYFMDYNSTKVTSITISKNQDGTYSFSGALRSNPSQGYYYYYYYEAEKNIFEYEPAEPDPYGNEPSDKKSFTLSANNLEVYSSKDKTPIDMYAWDAEDYSDVDLLFNVDSYDIPAGDYEISTSGELGTIIAGDGSAANPSCYHAANFGPEYYLVSGTLTVSYADGDMMIKGTATTAHGSTVALTLTGKDPFGHLLVNPVTFEANEDGETATVTGLDPTFTGTALVIPGTVAINGKNCTVTAIADQAFTKETGLQSIVIPATVEVIGKAAFSFCTGLTAIECQGSVAPSVGASAFYKINPAISVVVPAGAVNSYKAADGWKMFTGISAE